MGGSRDDGGAARREAERQRQEADRRRREAEAEQRRLTKEKDDIERYWKKQNSLHRHEIRPDFSSD